MICLSTLQSPNKVCSKINDQQSAHCAEFGVATSVDLIPGGSDIAVTAENRQEYIQLVCKYKLDKQIAAQSRAFFHGLSDIIDSKCTSIYILASILERTMLMSRATNV